MALDELAGLVGETGWTRYDRLVTPGEPKKRSEFRRSAVASGAILVQRLHGDPVEIAAQHPRQLTRLDPARLRRSGQGIPIRSDLGARSGRLFLAQLAEQLVERLTLLMAGFKWLNPAQQYVQNHTKRIHVGTRVDVLTVRIHLLRAHVSGSADELSKLRVLS